MSRVIIEASSSTPMTRTTAHNQFDGRVFGMRVLTRTVPIVLNMKQPGNILKGILLFGPATSRNVLYKDLGKVEKCCRQVYTFNIRHYTKCYLDSESEEPYTWNECKKCNVSIQDGKHTVSKMTKRSYRRNRYIYRADKTLQGCTNEEMFTPQDGLPRC